MIWPPFWLEFWKLFFFYLCICSVSLFFTRAPCHCGMQLDNWSSDPADKFLLDCGWSLAVRCEALSGLFGFLHDHHPCSELTINSFFNIIIYCCMSSMHYNTNVRFMCQRRTIIWICNSMHSAFFYKWHKISSLDSCCSLQVDLHPSSYLAFLSAYLLHSFLIPSILPSRTVWELCLCHYSCENIVLNQTTHDWCTFWTAFIQSLFHSLSDLILNWKCAFVWSISSN